MKIFKPVVCICSMFFTSVLLFCLILFFSGIYPYIVLSGSMEPVIKNRKHCSGSDKRDKDKTGGYYSISIRKAECDSQNSRADRRGIHYKRRCKYNVRSDSCKKGTDKRKNIRQHPLSWVCHPLLTDTAGHMPFCFYFNRLPSGKTFLKTSFKKGKH